MLNNGAKVDEVLISAFAAVESAHAYSAFLPSIFTIRHFGHEPGTAKAIRDGELAGTLFALGLGGVISALTKSQMPLIFSAGTAVVMISVYEYALRTREQPELGDTVVAGAPRSIYAMPMMGHSLEIQ